MIYITPLTLEPRGVFGEEETKRLQEPEMRVKIQGNLFKNKGAVAHTKSW